jgi:hypothetical protein
MKIATVGLDLAKPYSGFMEWTRWDISLYETAQTHGCSSVFRNA